MSVKHDTPSKWNTPGPLDVTQGSTVAWYRDSRYQACACSTGTVREAESRIDPESSRKAEKKRVFEGRTDESESFEISNRNPDRIFTVEDNTSHFQPMLCTAIRFGSTI